jgi:N-dimethylarginine dimethylaminohydrolase
MLQLPQPLDTGFHQDIPRFWGEWGVDSEVGRLIKVLVHRPGGEVSSVTEISKYRWKSRPDLEKMQKQHDEFTKILSENGVEVIELGTVGPDKADSTFVRDSMAMTPEGAIVSRMAMETRRGEEKYIAKRLAELGVPILRTIHGRGTFEGGNLTWLEPKTVLIGWGHRTNQEGIAQVEETLKLAGVERVVQIPVPTGYLHIDGFVSVIDKGMVLIYPRQCPQYLSDLLREKDFKVVASYADEERDNFAFNTLAIRPGRVICTTGNPRTVEILRGEGIDVIETDVSEFMKCGGSVHCMTQPLLRERP